MDKTLEYQSVIIFCLCPSGPEVSSFTQVGERVDEERESQVKDPLLVEYTQHRQGSHNHCMALTSVT